MGTYNRNLETNKLELHFDKSEYLALTDDQKKDIKSNFLFSRKYSAWVSRAKFPNLYWAEKVAESLGLEKTDNTGEKLTFEEQQERKAEKALSRAERYDYKSNKALIDGETLQKPINDMHGDIAFFTQPNINTSGGRAFTNKRNRMWAAFEKGMEEFRKSDYYAEKAETARRTAADTKTHDRGFCQRRIDEATKSIRKLTKSIDEFTSYLAKLEAGEELTDKYGWKLNYTSDQLTENIERWEEIREDAISKLAYYDNLMQEAGGVQFSKDNIEIGYIVKVSRYKEPVKVIGKGSKNITYQFNDGFVLTASYAEIEKIISKEIAAPEHPFKVNDQYTVERWNSTLAKYEPVTYTITKINGYKVTLKTGTERAISRTIRKGYNSNNYILPITDGLHGYISKAAKVTA